MVWIKEKHGKDFIFGLKSNRLCSDTPPEHGKKRTFKRIDQVLTEQDSLKKVWLDGVPFLVHIVRHLFTNEHGDGGVLYLVTSDLNLDVTQILALYHRRWKVEEFHKSLKSHAAIAASPAHTPKTQSNHVFAAFLAVIKLEKLARAATTNHAALVRSLFIHATAAAYAELTSIKLKLQSNPILCVT
jgi:transposase